MLAETALKGELQQCFETIGAGVQGALAQVIYVIVTVLPLQFFTYFSAGLSQIFTDILTVIVLIHFANHTLFAVAYYLRVLPFTPVLRFYQYLSRAYIVFSLFVQILCSLWMLSAVSFNQRCVPPSSPKPQTLSDLT